MSNCVDYSGMVFGCLTVVSEANKQGNYRMWLCRCKCGNEIVVRGSSLKNGHTKSCGCYHKEAASMSNTKHGLYKSRIYSIYQHMVGRCTNPKENGYMNYGGRGIKVCEEWLGSFEMFKTWAFDNGYSDKLTVDRIDVNGNYCPENCRWVSPKVQANNMRNNHVLEYNGVALTMAEWADKLNIKYCVINSRIFRGWSVEEALTTPVAKNSRRYRY